MECHSPKLTLSFWVYMAGYVISIIGLVMVIDGLKGSPLLWIACLIPAFFALMGLRQVFSGIMALDEMVRRIHMEAFMISAGLTTMISFTWGLLEHAGLPPMNATWVLPMISVLYAVVLPLRARHYK